MFEALKKCTIENISNTFNSLSPVSKCVCIGVPVAYFGRNVIRFTLNEWMSLITGNEAYHKESKVNLEAAKKDLIRLSVVTGIICSLLAVNHFATPYFDKEEQNNTNKLENELKLLQNKIKEEDEKSRDLYRKKATTHTFELNAYGRELRKKIALCGQAWKHLYGETRVLNLNIQEIMLENHKIVGENENIVDKDGKCFLKQSDSLGNIRRIIYEKMENTIKSDEYNPNIVLLKELTLTQEEFAKVMQNPCINTPLKEYLPYDECPTSMPG